MTVCSGSIVSSALLLNDSYMLIPKSVQWLLQGRHYGSASPKRLPRFDKTVSLDHFLQRGRALALWRQIIRGTRQITDPSTKKETRQMARDEFVRNKNVTDIGQIRYLISTGKTQWETMERYITGL